MSTTRSTPSWVRAVSRRVRRCLRNCVCVCVGGGWARRGGVTIAEIFQQKCMILHKNERAKYTPAVRYKCVCVCVCVLLEMGKCTLYMYVKQK